MNLQICHRSYPEQGGQEKKLNPFHPNLIVPNNEGGR